MWKIYKIKEIINDFQNGYAFKADQYVEAGVPIISMQSISLEGKFVFNPDTVSKWDENTLDKLTDFILKKDDLIIAMTDVTPTKNLIGCSTLVDRKGIFLLNQRVGKIEVNENFAFKIFLDYYFKSNIWRNYCRSIAGLSVQANISERGICRGKIKLPPLPEQKTIAAILSKVDEAIAAVEDSIKAAEKVKKALMQNLLTGKLKPDGTWRSEDEFYTDEKFGKIPKGWQVARFKNFAVLQRGKDLTDNNVISGNFPVVKSNGIQIYHNEYFVEPPGVVTGRSGTIGKVFYIENQFWSHNTTLYVKDFKSNYPKYIYYLIQRMKFEQHYAGTTVPTLNRNDIHKIKVSCPNNINEQKEIIIKIDETEQLIQTKHSKIEILKKLKKSLMQNLLTGKIRVNPSQFQQEISRFS